MKLRKLAFIAPALLAASLLTGCETTGNPREGGLFGWSETKAQGRIREREDYLNAVDSDTAYQNRRADRLDREAWERRQELNEYR